MDFLEPYNVPFRIVGKQCRKCNRTPIILYSRDETKFSCQCFCGHYIELPTYDEEILDEDFIMYQNEISNMWNDEYGIL